MTPHETQSANRILWAFLAVVGVLVVIGAIASQTRTEVTYPPGTVEHTVERYVSAAVNKDWPAARPYLVPALAEACDQEADRWFDVSDRRVVIESVSDVGGSATATIRLSDNSVNLRSSHSWTETLHLAHGDTGWLIDEAPWPLYRCEDTSS